VPVAWVCGKADAPGQMSLQGVDETSLPDMYLPPECRAIKH
jgi:hypothetical protein